MAKQLKRVAERYVAQQESYRNLPVPRPQASPVDVTPDEPVENASAARLRDIAEGLSSINSGLGDFFRMEKSFEETNRMEAKVRAQMNLPYDPDGKGLLNYGVAAGYEEGRGVYEGQEAMLAIQRRLEEAQYGITDENLSNPQAVSKFVDSTVDEVLKEMTRGNPSKAYLQGMAPLVTQAKVEARIKGEGVWRAKEKEARASNFSKFVNTHWEAMVYKDMKENLLSGERPDPQKLRNTLAELTRIGRDQYNFDRNTAAVYILENVQGSLVREMTKALSRDGSFADIQDLEDISQVLLESLEVPDASGIRLQDLKEPEVMQSVESIRATAEAFNNRASAVRTKNQALQADKVLGGGVSLVMDNASPAEVLEYVNKSFRAGDIEGSAMLTILGQLKQAKDAGLLNPVPDQLMDKWLITAASGDMDYKQLVQLQIDTRMPEESFKLLDSAISKHRAGVGYSISLRNEARSEDLYKLNMSEAERKAITKENTEQIKVNLSQVDEGAKEFVASVISRQFPFLDEPIDGEELMETIDNSVASYKRYMETKIKLQERLYNQQQLKTSEGIFYPGQDPMRKAIDEYAEDQGILAVGPMHPRFREVSLRQTALYNQQKTMRNFKKTTPVFSNNQGVHRNYPQQ